MKIIIFIFAILISLAAQSQQVEIGATTSLSPFVTVTVLSDLSAPFGYVSKIGVKLNEYNKLCAVAGFDVILGRGEIKPLAGFAINYGGYGEVYGHMTPKIRFGIHTRRLNAFTENYFDYDKILLDSGKTGYLPCWKFSVGVSVLIGKLRQEE